MPDDAAFLRAALAAPDDDLPRLVYADYLDERGDPRGEFIRVQLAIARLADEPRSEFGLYGTGPPRPRDPRDRPRLDTLRFREFALLSAHLPKWVAPLGPAVTGVRFWRGFIDTVRCPAATFLADGAAWAESMTVRRLRLYAVRGHLTALAASPLLTPVRAIELDEAEPCEDVVLALVRSPFVAGLRELYLGDDALTDVAARSILQSPYLVGLTVLRPHEAGRAGRPPLTAEVAHALRRRFGHG